MTVLAPVGLTPMMRPCRMFRSNSSRDETNGQSLLGVLFREASFDFGMIRVSGHWVLVLNV